MTQSFPILPFEAQIHLVTETTLIRHPTAATMIFVSSTNAQEAHFYTLPEQQEGIRIKSSKKWAVANKDWMGTPVSRQQSKRSTSSSLRRNKKNTYTSSSGSVDTVDMDDIIKKMLDHPPFHPKRHSQISKRNPLTFHKKV